VKIKKSQNKLEVDFISPLLIIQANKNATKLVFFISMTPLGYAVSPLTGGMADLLRRAPARREDRGVMSLPKTYALYLIAIVIIKQNSQLHMPLFRDRELPKVL